MAFRRVTCVIAVCDVCGSSQDPDGGEPHFETEADAVQFALGDQAHLPDTWYQRADGRLVCWRRNAVHDQARVTDAHYQPGSDPWGVHFTEVEEPRGPQ
jgi:hypothetical protein